jgi:hypothetical protein
LEGLTFTHIFVGLKRRTTEYAEEAEAITFGKLM